MLWFPVAVLVMAGCGEEEPEAAAEGKPEATATATPDPRDAAKKEIRTLVADWLEATAKEDAETRCELLAPSERRHFDRVAGDCATAYAPRGSAKQRELGRRVAGASRPGTIIVYEGGYATIEVHHAKAGNYITLYAIDEKGSWGIARKKRTGL
jgi:hypothetical protein